MSRTFTELPGWLFEVTERSAGVYNIIGTDARGHRVETTGTDADALLGECREMAARVIAELRAR